MTEFGFDRRNGELLVGAAAVGLRQEEAGAEVLSLPKLLTAPDFPFKEGDFEGPETSWNAEKCLEIGKWTLNMLTANEEEVLSLQKEHFRRLRIIRLGPALREVTIKNGFQNFTHYKQQVGAPMMDVRGAYADWTPDHLLSYVRKTWGDSKITGAEIDRKAARGKGPSTYVLGKIFGSVGELNALRGYYDFGEGKPSDYTQWGAKVIAANGNDPSVLTSTVIDILSRRDQGPSYNWIIRLFRGKLQNFQEEVEPVYAQLIEEEKHARMKLAHAVLTFQNGGVSPGINHELYASNRVLIQYLLTHTVDMSTTKLASIAERVGVLNILWPPDRYREKLRVSEEELTEARTRNAITRRRYPASYVKRSAS